MFVTNLLRNSSTDTSEIHNLLWVFYVRCTIFYSHGRLFQGFAFANILLVLLLSTLVFAVAVQRWRKQRQSSSEAANSRQSDAFTFNVVAMEMSGVLVNACFLALYYSDTKDDFFSRLFYIISSVKVQFLLLTCVEFYLAVVHPVIYLRLKSSGGVWIRGISAAVVWLLCILCGVVSYWYSNTVTMVLCLCLLVLDMVVVSFCCISVLWTLKRPGPGENSEDRMDPSKQRAFRTIVKIMLVIWLCLVGMLVFFSMEVLTVMIDLRICFSTAFTYWLTLPSTLLLPLLFLQRAGKRLCCKK